MPGTKARLKFLSSFSLAQIEPQDELALSRGPLGQRLSDLVSQYGLKAAKRAERKLALIARLQPLHPKTQLFHGCRVPAEGVRALAQEAGVGVGTLYRWRQRFIQAGKAAEGDPVLAVYLGFTALIDHKKGVVRFPTTDSRIKVNERLRLLIQGLYSRRTRPSGAKIWKRLVAQCVACRQAPMIPTQRGFRGLYRLHRCPCCGFELSYSTVLRVIREIPPAVKALGRAGKRAFREQYGAYIPRTYQDLRNREIFSGDHHEFDLFVYSSSGKLFRPWVSAWLDLKTEVLAGWFISERPNSQTIALAYRHAVLPKRDKIMGLSESVYVDNGRDYRSRYLEGESGSLGRLELGTTELFAKAHGVRILGEDAMEGLWRQLGVKSVHTLPANPQAKPIERFFGTVERDLIQELPGWCGNSPEARPADILKPLIQKHEDWRVGRREETPFLHIAEFALRFEAWVHERYLRTPHARLDCSPLEAYEREYGRPVVPAERALDILLMRAERRLIRRNGIEMFERGRWYWSEELAGRGGTYMEVRWDPRELGRVLIYTDQGFLCEARNLELLGFHATLEQFQGYKRMQRVQQEVVMAHLALMHMAASDISLLELATKPQELRIPTRKRLKGQIEALAAQSPVGTTLALSSGSSLGKPIFTSRAQKEAWERQHGLAAETGEGR
jgi:transposase InsO family protein